MGHIGLVARILAWPTATERKPQRARAADRLKILPHVGGAVWLASGVASVQEPTHDCQSLRMAHIETTN